MRGTWTPPVQCAEREGNFQSWPIQRKDLETMLRCSQTSDGTLPFHLLPQGLPSLDLSFLSFGV